MKRGYRRRLAAIAAVGAILLLVSVVSACASGNDVTVIGDLVDATQALVLRGPVIANSTSTPNSVTNIVFRVINKSPVGEPVDLSDTGTNAAILIYTDKDQRVIVAPGDWSASWITGTGKLVDPGDSVVIDVTVSGLSTKLKANKRFTIQLKPTVGEILTISRTTPLELGQVMELK